MVLRKRSTYIETSCLDCVGWLEVGDDVEGVEGKFKMCVSPHQTLHVAVCS
jgi:hypothetical protein